MIGWFIAFLVIILLIWWVCHHHKKLKSHHLDARGYQRDGYGRLVHRRIAYNNCYDSWKYPCRFGELDVHHKDENKLNNTIENLKVLTREAHEKIHEHKNWI